jgi:uncharacterized repeat protein (TIGR03803 family)
MLPSCEVLLRRLFFVSLACVATTGGMQVVQAQTYQVLHSFTGGADGAFPTGALASDSRGTLYGTASTGGNTGGSCPTQGCGAVFQLKNKNGSWLFTPLFDFPTHGNSGITPYGGVAIGPDGSLYGTTSLGGPNSLGTVFNLKPPSRVTGNLFASWSYTRIHTFALDGYGYYPLYGSLTLDAGGNIYGTASEGGYFDGECSDDGGCGTVFKLTRGGGGWTISAFQFLGRASGSTPYSGVIMDGSGNLYGTTVTDGINDPIAYELTPEGAGWNETVLHTFPIDQRPQGGVIFDAAGDLAGTSFATGALLGNVAYQLSSAGGDWTYRRLHAFPGSGPTGPWSGLTRDSNGNLYGTTCSDGMFAQGSIFKLSPSQGGWTLADLHDFSGSDGGCPIGNMVIDPDGTVYGTASGGGDFGWGVVWKLAP